MAIDATEAARAFTPRGAGLFLGLPVRALAQLLLIGGEGPPVNRGG